MTNTLQFGLKLRNSVQTKVVYNPTRPFYYKLQAANQVAMNSTQCVCVFTPLMGLSQPPQKAGASHED